MPKARETRDTRHTGDMVAVGGHSLYRLVSICISKRRC
jgi:hypothetical protein